MLKVPYLAPQEELIVFANQIWKPQFLSVVQFPLDICHSPFSLTTFFEIGVYLVFWQLNFQFFCVASIKFNTLVKSLSIII